MSQESYDREVYEPAGPGRIRCLLCHKSMAKRGWFLHELRSTQHGIMVRQGLLFPAKCATRVRTVGRTGAA